MEMGMDMKPESEWINLEIKIPISGIKEFYKKFTSRDFSLMWYQEQDDLYLAVSVPSGMYQIPFTRNSDSMDLGLSYLPIFHKGIVECLEESLVDFKGSGNLNKFEGEHINSFEYRRGKLQNIKEIDIAGNVVSKDIIDSSVSTDVKTRLKIVELEIDYYLMELSGNLTGDLDVSDKVKNKAKKDLIKELKVLSEEQAKLQSQLYK